MGGTHTNTQIHIMSFFWRFVRYAIRCEAEYGSHVFFVFAQMVFTEIVILRGVGLFKMGEEAFFTHKCL